MTSDEAATPSSPSPLWGGARGGGISTRPAEVGSAPDLAGIAAALAAKGLAPRGVIVFTPEDDAPAGLGRRPAGSALLVGNSGGAMWRHFMAWRAGQAKMPADPLDAWSKTVIGEVARLFGARAVSPSDRPYLPFQQWGMRAEGLRPSPLGILMHPEYGLWHAYRGALLFDAELPDADPHAMVHVCDACAEKPCLKSCPVSAYTGRGFAHAACLAHVRGPDGEACRTGGCLDRNACPHAAEHRYPVDMQAFLMEAFARS